MNSHSFTRSSSHGLPSWAFLLLGTAFAILPSATAAPFTEPPVTFYGSVNQVADGYTVPVRAGTIRWTIQPPTAAAVVSSVDVGTGSDGQSSFYRLKIPVEKVPAGSVVSGNTINAPVAATSFGRTNVSLNGTTPLSIVFPAGSAAGSFTFNEAARGKIEQVNLVLTAPFTDSDGDGLPDWFEDKYGLDKYNPNDGTAVDRHGKRSFLDDYQRHIDPALGTEYEQWADVKIPAATPAAPTDDPDADGIINLVEFALDTNPKSPDMGNYNVRVVRGTTVIGGKNYLTLTVNLPTPRRASAGYTVESSGDLRNWASAESTDVVTLTGGSDQLYVRDAKSIEESVSGRRYLRLRVNLAQQ